MNVWDAIRSKHAVRAFQEKELTEAEIRQILDAGRRAMSSYNTQPWQFIAVTDAQKRQTLSKIGRSCGHAAGAPLVIVLLTPTTEEAQWAHFFDLGQATAYMMLAAQEMGIGSCPGTVTDYELARSAVHFPEDWSLNVILSFGYPDVEQHPPRPPKKGGRKPFDEVVHWEEW